MRATDLQVGNYVMVHPSNMVIQVAVVFGKLVGYIASGKHIEWIEESLIRPIPLCKVHLTKNGFKASDALDWQFVYKDGYEIKVCFEEDVPDYGIKEDFCTLSIEFADKELWMEVKYLHTLQQAMKLLEVDKEIVI